MEAARANSQGEHVKKDKCVLEDKHALGDKVVRLEVFRALRAKLAAEAAQPAPRGVCVPTGVEALDAATGGLRRGAVTEFSGSTGQGSLFFSALLETTGRERWHMALIDAADQFEPADWDAAAMRRLLWVRSREAKKALRAADLLLRDGNLPLVVLDFQGVPVKQLRGIPTNVWHRLQRVVEESGVALVVLSRWPMVEGARVRVEADARLGLEAMRVKRRDLAAGMTLRVRQKTIEREVERRTA
jgi:hypothetical protein